MYKFDYEEFEKACEQKAKERKDKELSDLRDHFAGLAMQVAYDSLLGYI